MEDGTAPEPAIAGCPQTASDGGGWRALAGLRSERGFEAQVEADVGDDFGDRAIVLFVEVRGVEPVEEFFVEGGGDVAVGLALPGVFDLADDAPAAAVGGIAGGIGGGFGSGGARRVCGRGRWCGGWRG